MKGTWYYLDNGAAELWFITCERSVQGSSSSCEAERARSDGGVVLCAGLFVCPARD